MKVKLKLGVVVAASAAPLLTALAYSWVQTEANAQAEQQIRKVEEERRQAILRNDIKALDSLMAPEYTAIFQLFGGRVHTKAEELALNQSDAREVQSWDPTDVTIRVYNQVGLVTGLAEIVDVLQGNRRHIRVRYTHMWVKRNGKWQLVHRHTTRVATIEGPAPPGAAASVPSTDDNRTNSPTKEDVAKEIRRRWDVFNSGNLDEIVKNDMGGFGFGWRTAAPRSVAGFGGVDARDVAARGSEALRDPIKRFLDSMEHYHATLEELDTAVDGEIGLAWGILTEDFKLKGQPSEKARVRFTQALKKEGERWRPLLDHRDIQPFDEHGRYLSQSTLSANNATPQGQPGKSSGQMQPLGPTDSDTGPDAQAVLARTEELNQAFLHADLAALNRIIADDCVQITKDGAATKEEWLAPYRSGTKRFDGTNPKPPEWRRIRLYGDVAVVTSAGEISMVVQGEPRTYRLFNTRTWVKRAGQWYLVLAQNTLRDEQDSRTK